MTDQVDPKLAKQVAKTQEMLLPYVKKGLLVEKHLARPPFRQLHDIFMNITQSTGFFKGLFTQEEMDSGNIKSKEAKVAFLQKIIDVVALATGQAVSVRPSKILAGHEVEKTNDFLQELGKALKAKVNSQQAINTVLGKSGAGNGDGAPQPASSSDAKRSSTTVTSTNSKPPKDPSPSRKPAATGATGKPAAKNAQPPVAKSKDKTSTSKLKPTQPAISNQRGRGSTEKLNTKTQPMRVVPPSQRPTGKDKKPEPQVASRRSSLSRQDEQDMNASAARPRSGSLGSIGGRQGKQAAPVVKAVEKVSSASVGDFRNTVEDDILDSHDEVGLVLADSNLPVDDIEIEEPEIEVDEKVNELSINNPMHDNVNDEHAKSNVAEVSVASSPSTHPNLLEPDRGRTAGRVASKTRQPSSSVGRGPGPVVPPSPTTKVAAEAQKIATEAAATAAAPAQSQGSGPPSSAESKESERSGFFSRPMSARPGAPRPKTASTNWGQDDSRPFRPPTSKVTSVLLDKGDEDGNNDDDEADKFIIQETTTAPSDDPFGFSSKSLDTLADEDNDNIKFEELAPEQRGFLVNQLMETKKELEEKSEGGAMEELNESEKSKLREVWESEIETLKGLLQTIARSSNPLGKLMDYVQEDIETMTNEINKYKDENHKLDLMLEEEQRKLKQELEPLQKQLDEVDDLIKDQEDAIIGTKLEILEQEEKIKKILHGLESVPDKINTAPTVDLKNLAKSIKIFGTDVNFLESSTASVFGESEVGSRGVGIGTVVEPSYSPVPSASAVHRSLNRSGSSFLQVPEEDLNSLVMDDMEGDEEE